MMLATSRKATTWSGDGACLARDPPIEALGHILQQTRHTVAHPDGSKDFVQLKVQLDDEFRSCFQGTVQAVVRDKEFVRDAASCATRPPYSQHVPKAWRHIGAKGPRLPASGDADEIAVIPLESAAVSDPPRHEHTPPPDKDGNQQCTASRNSPRALAMRPQAVRNGGVQELCTCELDALIARRRSRQHLRDGSPEVGQHEAGTGGRMSKPEGLQLNRRNPLSAQADDAEQPPGRAELVRQLSQSPHEAPLSPCENCRLYGLLDLRGKRMQGFPSKSSKNAEKAMKETSVSSRQTCVKWEIVCVDRPSEIHASLACMLPMIAL